LAPYPRLANPKAGPERDSVNLQDGKQREFAEAIHVPLATLQNWKQRRTVMDPATLVLTTILAQEPKAALRWGRRRRK